jgi:hypothetical protein
VRPRLGFQADAVALQMTGPGVDVPDAEQRRPGGMPYPTPRAILAMNSTDLRGPATW